uniref:(northern house mosquito) hypothetical protein n=1 Tax=Culex pipiens TaxID=7175 RepID=A0A8D8N0B9_CULPI
MSKAHQMGFASDAHTHLLALLLLWLSEIAFFDLLFCLFLFSSAARDSLLFYFCCFSLHFFLSFASFLTDSLVHSPLLLFCVSLFAPMFSLWTFLRRCFYFLFFFTVVDVTKLSERVRPRVRFIKRARKV